MDGGQPFQSGLVDALQRTDPQFQVRVHGVLHQNGDVHALQCVGYLLHGEGVGRGAGADPQDVDAGLQGLEHVLGSGHFGSHVHARFLFHFLEPGQAFYAYALEASGFGAGFPDTGTEYLDAAACQLAGGFHHLFFSFGAAGACNHQGAFVVHARECDFL